MYVRQDVPRVHIHSRLKDALTRERAYIQDDGTRRTITLASSTFDYLDVIQTQGERKKLHAQMLQSRTCALGKCVLTADAIYTQRNTNTSAEHR